MSELDLDAIGRAYTCTCRPMYDKCHCDGDSRVTDAIAELRKLREINRDMRDEKEVLHKMLSAVEVERDRLREENARLKAPVDTKGIERSCDDCQQPYAVWFAPNEIWNFVMGGADCKGDPGGMLCPRCFTLRAEAAGVVPTAWEVRPERFLDEENRWRAGRKG